ncbi:MAG: imidazoleglycerol-phosphate dehydratase HisB [bacterium]|nr:imidazoleglycerol-phosphate dehydratase HisB [candidate division KSB1 bacterium]MDH7560751.1 imidazoleglycerol-phosphate dehydratase HisB [bacterium]
MKRSARAERRSRETEVIVELSIDGKGQAHVTTPIGLLTHMLETFAKHGLFDLTLSASGDLHVDQHHLLEDCGLVLGKAFAQALGDKRGINRAGYFVYPMDEALAVVAVDIGGRPYLQYDVHFSRQFCGDLDSDLLEDFFYAFAVQLGGNVVVRMPYGRSDHHKMEAIFKAFAKALAMACQVNPRAAGEVPSTKGLIDDRDS